MGYFAKATLYQRLCAPVDVRTKLAAHLQIKIKKIFFYQLFSITLENSFNTR